MTSKFKASLFLSLAFSASPVFALTWDDAGATNNWNTTDLNWNPGLVAWTNGSDAEFNGTGETITQTQVITAGTVTFSTAGYTIDSNTFDATWGTLAGTGGFTKSGLGTLTLSNASTASGAVNINGGKITLGNNSALGTTSITLNGGTIERNAPGQTVTNAVTIGATGGTILGRQVVDDYTLFSGQLTGSGALTIQGLVALNNTSNTYSGPITISTASSSYLRLSASEVIGNAATLNLAGTNATLRLDGGVTETIAALSGSGNIFVSKTGAILPGTLKFGSNNANTSYTGALNNNDGQLFLVKQGTGTFTLAPTNTNYAGLTISNGTVLSTNGNGGGGPLVTLGDADTGSGNVAFLTTTGVSRNITVSANGNGTATIGSTTGAAGNVSFGGTVTLNRATTITAASSDRTSWTGKITGNVGTLTISGGNRTVFESANGLNDFVGNVLVTGTNTVLQIGVGNLTGENIPNASNLTVDAGAVVKLASLADNTETVNAINGNGVIRRHESTAVTGLQTLVIGSADGSGSFGGNLLDGGGGKLAIRKIGTGTQTITSVAGNTASGGITVDKGILKFTGTAGFDGGTFGTAQTYNVNNGGTLEISGDWLTKSTSTYNINEGGILAFTKTSGDTTLSYVNNLNLTSATVNGPGAYRIGNNTSATHNFSGDLGNVINSAVGFVKNGASQTIIFNVNDGAADADLRVNGVVYDVTSFTGSTFVKSGSGKMVLAGGNSYIGGTVIRSGTVEGIVGSAFGSGTITLGDASTGSSAASLYLGQRADIGNNVTVSSSGTGLVKIGASNTGSGFDAAIFSGTITLNRATTFSGEIVGDRLALDGKITGPVGTLTVSGGQRTTFAATTNDFVGDILVTGAGTILQASVATAAEVIPNASSVTVDSGAILQLASTGGAETINGLNGAGKVRTFPTAGFGSNLTVGSANGSGNFTGQLENGTNPLSLTKIGSGTQILSGSSTYSGATLVSAGTLLINNTTGSGTGTSAVTVAGGATFGGTGSMTGLVTTQSGSFLSPGASIESLTVGSVTGSGTLLFEYDGAAGAPIDQLFVTGSFDITSLTLSFTQTGSSLTDPAYVFASYGSLAGSAFGSVTSLPIGYELDYNYQSANQIALVAVPEPSISVTLLAVCGGMMFRRRRSA